MQLVIAEKPSVARSIAGVIGADQKKDGYMEGNGYLVSWCIGHLVSLADAGAYDERFKKWRYDDLPILPQEWQYIIPAEKKGQFAVLRSLMERPDVTGLVCATDAGREGELIFRFVYQMAGCKKPFKRLWISSMEDAAIREGFAYLKPGADYDDLYQSALCRAQADWLVGINATRLFSILYHKTLTVGRVQTPTLNMLVDREAKISKFKKEKYHVVHIAAGGMEAASDRFMNPDDADATKTACAGAQAVCVSVKREKKTEQPPRLYDLTTLQREANRLFGFTAKQTLDYAQQLYEKKLLTYPRTDSQYLTDDMQPTAESIVSGLWPLLSFAAGLDIAPQFGRVLNSKKVSDHHAIIPTMEFVQKGFDGLTEGEKKLLSLVCCKLLCAVAAPHVYEAVTATFTCAGNEFTAKGKTILPPAGKRLSAASRRRSRPTPTRTRRSWHGSCRRSPRARPLTRWRPASPSISPRRPSPTPKIRFCPLWNGPGPRICRRTPSAKVWEPRQPALPFWKSWCRWALWNAKANSYFPPRTATTLCASCRMC